MRSDTRFLLLYLGGVSIAGGVICYLGGSSSLAAEEGRKWSHGFKGRLRVLNTSMCTRWSFYHMVSSGVLFFVMDALPEEREAR